MPKSSFLRLGTHTPSLPCLLLFYNKNLSKFLKFPLDIYKNKCYNTANKTIKNIFIVSNKRQSFTAKANLWKANKN